MIGYLSGRLVEVNPGEVIVEAGGVGYELRVPVSSYGLLAGSPSASLFVHTHVREDQISLFGFLTRRERDTFRQLIGVSGVGPRTALALLSGLSPEELGVAVESEQWRRLATVPGIGKRTAERLIVELKGKLAIVGPITAATAREDAVSALINLGYPVRAAEDAVVEILRGQAGIELGELLRKALQNLAR